MRKYLWLLCLMTLLVNAKEDFYIVQDAKSFEGDDISLKKRPFTIVSDDKYYVVFSKEPIDILQNKRKILKLLGTSAVWDINGSNAVLYKSSDVWSDYDMCELYDEVKCKEYGLKKRALGFGNAVTYTFASYPVVEKRKKFYTIDDKFIKDISNSYYIYLFKDIDKIDDVSTVQKVKYFKVDFVDSTEENFMQILYFSLAILAYITAIYYWLTRKRRREQFIKSYSFPSALEESLSRFSQLEKEQVLEGLRAYFILLNQANNIKFFVPSLVLMKTWREFIKLDEYPKFSKKAFGILIVPPSRSKKINKDTLRNAFKTVWSLSQEQEGIEDKTSRKLPSIFNLDRALNVPNGTLFRFKKNKERGSKKRRKNNDFNSGSSFSISYSSTEYSEFSFELNSMESYTSSEKSMSDYSDNVGYNSSSNSSDTNSSSSSSDSSSSTSSSSSDSDSGGD